MNKYRKLVSNTLLFGVASFSSRFLSIFITMVLTRVFTREQVSTGQLVIDTCNFIAPIISLCIHEAVIRFGLDKSEKKSDVFTTAVMTILIGYLLLLALWPAVSLIPFITGYVLHVYIYVLTSALRSTATHFVRASGFVRIFAIDGLITTISTVIFTFTFIIGLGMGVEGYIWAIIAADALSAFGLIFFLKLYRFFIPRRFSKSTLKAMLVYSAPLVPTAVFWWVTNLSDRYMVAWMVSDAANGLYTVAYRIPTMVVLVSAVFTQAWQISAFTEFKSEERVKFYSTVFNAYHALVALAASGLILLAKPLNILFWGEEFADAWMYAPFLILATSFSCLVTFLGTIYNAAKSNRMVTITTMAGAILNVALNLVFIPRYGAAGAALSTFASYFLVFLLRAVDTRRYIALRIRPLRMGISFGLLVIQAWADPGRTPYWLAIQISAMLLLVLFNLGYILYVAQYLMHKIRARRAAA